MKTNKAQSIPLKGLSNFFMEHTPEEDKKMKKLNAKITTLVHKFILDTPTLLASYRKNHTFDFRFNESRLEIQPFKGEWINSFKLKNLDHKQLKQLYQINKLFSSYVKEALIKDHCINTSSVYIPGISAVFRFPFEIKKSRKEIQQASLTKDRDGYNEALHKCFSQSLAVFGSLALLADFIQNKIVNTLFPAAMGVTFTILGSTIGLAVCLIEMVREISWIKFSSNAIQDLHLKTIKKLQAAADLLKAKERSGEKLDLKEQKQLISLVIKVIEDVKANKNYTKEEREELVNKARKIAKAIKTASKNNKARKNTLIYQKTLQNVLDIREKFIKKDFTVLAKDIESKKVLKKRSRQFGANFTARLALNETIIKAAFESNNPDVRQLAFDKGVDFLSSAKKQAIKKIVLYSLGILVCALNMVMFALPGINIIMLLLIASVVAGAFSTARFYEKFVEGDGIHSSQEKLYIDFFNTYQMQKGLEKNSNMVRA